MKQLNRDYQVISTKHQELLSRRESAKLGEDVEQTASDVTFRVIDPPFVPSKPSEPSKLLLNSIVLVAALWRCRSAVALLIADQASGGRPAITGETTRSSLAQDRYPDSFSGAEKAGNPGTYRFRP
ncbi:MAG: hypothetical protein R3E50_16070 [Halioglobus sp.]